MFLEKAPGRRYDFVVDDARVALAKLPLARAWMHFAWLTGGSWTPLDDDEVAADEAECRRDPARGTRVARGPPPCDLNVEAGGVLLCVFRCRPDGRPREALIA